MREESLTKDIFNANHGGRNEYSNDYPPLGPSLFGLTGFAPYPYVSSYCALKPPLRMNRLLRSHVCSPFFPDLSLSNAGFSAFAIGAPRIGTVARSRL